MAKTTVRSTFALDPDTVADLDRLAGKWGVSKSETLRRLVRTAATLEEVDWAADAVRALDELQDSLELSPEQAEAWIAELRAERDIANP